MKFSIHQSFRSGLAWSLIAGLLHATPVFGEDGAYDGPPDADAMAAMQAPEDALPETALPADQIQSLVAPVALYPDQLLSQVLVAATYPLEITQAWQWLQQNSGLQGSDLTAAAAQQNWDASVQALVIFPDLLERMSDDIDWTTQLGNVFLAQQAEVMDAVQRLRAQAQRNGKLISTAQQRVVNTTDEGQPVIEIQSADPQVVYVPYYDPATVWGPVPDYPYPVLYTPSRAVWGPRGFWFGPGISLSLAFAGCCAGGGWGWQLGWRQHAVVVNNSFIHRYDFHEGVTHGTSGNAVWRHDPAHRAGVAYPTRSTVARYHPIGAHPLVKQAPSVARPVRTVVTSMPAERFGSHPIAPSVFNRNRSAFGGIEAGAAARAHSDRGFASLNRARAATKPLQPARTFGAARGNGRTNDFQGGHH